MRFACYAIGAAALLAAAYAVVLGDLDALAPTFVIIFAAALCASITGSKS